MMIDFQQSEFQLDDNYQYFEPHKVVPDILKIMNAIGKNECKREAYNTLEECLYIIEVQNGWFIYIEKCKNEIAEWVAYYGRP